MRQYAKVPMDFADALLVALGEALGLATVFTTDRRGFLTYRSSGAGKFTLIPRGVVVSPATRSTGTRNAATSQSLSLRRRPVPQYSSLADIEAALSDGRLTRSWELLLSEKMVRDQDAKRVLSLLEQQGVAFTVSPQHHGDAIASRAERRSSA